MRHLRTLIALILTAFLCTPAFAAVPLESAQEVGTELLLASADIAPVPLVTLSQAPEAPAPVPPDTDIQGLALMLLDAMQSGKWNLAAAILLVGVVGLLRTVGARYWPPLRHRAAGPILAIAASLAGALLTTLVAGQPVTGALLLTALVNAVLAVGVYSGGKNVVQASPVVGSKVAAG